MEAWLLALVVTMSVLFALLCVRACTLSGKHTFGQESIFRMIKTPSIPKVLHCQADIDDFVCPVVRHGNKIVNRIRCSASGWSWNASQFANSENPQANCNVRLAGELARVHDINKHQRTVRVGAGLMVCDLVKALEEIGLELPFVGNCFGKDEAQQMGALVANNVHHSYTPPMSEIVSAYELMLPEVTTLHGVECIKLRTVRFSKDSPNFKCIAGAGGTTGIVSEITIAGLRPLSKYEAWSWPIVPSLRHKPPSLATLVDFRKLHPDSACMWISLDALTPLYKGAVNRWRTIGATPVSSRIDVSVKPKRSVRNTKYPAWSYIMQLALPQFVLYRIMRFHPYILYTTIHSITQNTNYALGVTQDIQHIEFELGIIASHWDRAVEIFVKMGLCHKLFCAVRYSPPVQYSYLGFDKEWTVFVGFHRFDRKLQTHTDACKMIVADLRKHGIVLYVHLGKAGAETPSDTVRYSRGESAASHLQRVQNAHDPHGILSFYG